MAIEIRFVGGPADGRTHAFPNDEPPPLYLVPIAPSIAELFSGSLEPLQIRTADYEPQLADGWPSRADDGAYLYQHRAPAATSEQCQALAESRTAVERRTAELDEAWREIRKERPNYPEDWRNLWGS
ncbi:hypothetical protein [Streptomyces sp. BH055]|uniref:hypothetical protein n=1 Tax=Streptomyces sp. BH055 TaxID=3401173 RepID=UPI003BB5F10C